MTPTAFAKTLGALNTAGHTGPLMRLGAGIAILGALGWWMAKVPVSLVETSSEARVEIAAAATVVQSALIGRVTQADLALGRRVQAGDVLVQLDALPEELQKRETEARLHAIPPEVAGLQAQIAAEESAGADEQRASLAAIAEQQARVREAEAPAKFAEIERQRQGTLRREGLIATRESERADSEAERLRNSTATASSAIERLEREQKARDRQRAVRIAELRTQITRLESTRAGIVASVRKTDYEVERRVIRAPVSGTIGESTLLRPGSVLLEGTRVSSIVATGQLRLVALFPPQAAYGRIPAGAHARLRLKGYPWTEFGVVEAKVAQVGGEDRDGKVRVELDVMPSPTLKTALRHGMPGELEVDVERITPLALVFRTAGQWITKTSPGSPAK